MKEVFAPSLGRNVKFGRRLPRKGTPMLRLSNYMKATFPSVPTSYDWTPPAAKGLADIDGNDTLGDCAEAAISHILDVWLSNAGVATDITRAQTVALYSAATGYNPADPNTDQGTNLVDLLNYLVAHPAPSGTKLTAWLAVDATNVAEMNAALYLFENLDYGLALPDAWVSSMPNANGFTWDVAGPPNPENGHSFPAGAYSSNGDQKIITWGLTGTLTKAAIAKYAVPHAGGELYTLLSTDMLIKGQSKAPNGIAWADLISDWDKFFGGAVPVPAPAPIPAPPPAPAPAPGSAVTLAMAQAWADTAFAHGFPLLTRAQAQSLVNAALAKNWPSS